MNNGTRSNELIRVQDIEYTKNLFPELTDKQTLILHMYALGMSHEVIARNTATSISNTKKHMSEIKKRLNCFSGIETRQVYLSRIVNFSLSKMT